jgi:hypothetical protein
LYKIKFTQNFLKPKKSKTFSGMGANMASDEVTALWKGRQIGVISSLKGEGWGYSGI